MATAELKQRKETKTQECLESDSGRREARDDRREQVVGIVASMIVLALYVFAIVLASIYGEPTELDQID